MASRHRAGYGSALEQDTSSSRPNVPIAGGTAKSTSSSGRRSTLQGIDFARWRGAPANTVIARGRPARLVIITFFAFIWVAALVWRMYSLQVADFGTWRDWAIRQHVAEIQVASERGPVLDRNGKLLAVSVPAGSVFLRPKLITDRERVIRELSAQLDLKPRQIAARLDTKQPFVWLKRQVPRFMTDKIEALGMAGVGVVMESRRFYPYNQAASTLIGKVGVDGAGLSGIESLFEKRLHVDHVTTKASRDAFGKIIQASSDGIESPFSVPKGAALTLTIDADLQIIMDEEVEAGRKAANAKHAMAVMVDSETGEIVALSQSPSFNFNISHDASKSALKNLLVETVFEPGSVMKPIVASAAIDAGLLRPTDMLNCENGRFPFGSHTIKDVHPSGVISLFDVVVRSSNIGMTKVGMKMGSERLYQYLRKFGFGQSTSLGLAGESGGILRPLSRWSKVDLATHAFGQGVAVTPLQVVRAVAAIANGGILPKLSVVVDDSGIQPGARVISANAAEMAREMMYGVTEDKHGTGGKAKVEGLRVGGKTGTAQKASPGGRGYAAGSYVASFVGFVDGAPAGVPRNLTTMVVIDEPKAGTIYGGTLAAPVFQRIMERSFRFLGTRTELGGRVNRSPQFLDPDSSSRSPSIRAPIHRGPFSDQGDELFPASFSQSEHEEAPAVLNE